MLLPELVVYLSKLLMLDEFKNDDASQNGLQVDRCNKEIKKIAFAVDACLASFQRAIDVEADIIIVHHGLFWGMPQQLSGDLYKRIRYLVEKDLALFAAHLPLDSHPELGNNASMANQLSLTNIEPFGLYHGRKIGFKGVFSEPKSLDFVIDKLGINSELCPSIFTFGNKSIHSVGLVSGGASSDVLQALEEDLDLFITGEASHEVYHYCLEGKINFIAAGHYFTETFGVRSLSKYINQELGLETVFVDVPTGL